MPRKKPPLGITPRHVVETNRALEILQGIARYIEACKPIPKEWRTELDELLDNHDSNCPGQPLEDVTP